MALVIRLGDEASSVHDMVGGKGANLARLLEAGFPVPPACCVTTEAYSAFLAEAGLADKIVGLAGGIDHTEPAHVEQVSGEIAALVAAATVPGDIAAAITGAYAALGAEPYVAVRSSGTAEDLAEASFAGLHDTYLDVRGAEAVLDAVKRCWASLWTPRAIVYRHNNGFSHAEARLAVVIQTMVEADVAGVMFTANPLTTATDQTLINASWGLGEAVVSGAVTPDQFVVRNNDLTVLERVTGTKDVRIVRDPAGGVMHLPVSEAEQSRLTLTDGQAAELAGLGRRIQVHYDGFPQDTEWALAGGTIYLLQSRPVTGVEFSWDADVEDGIWGGIPADDDTIWSRAFADEITTGAVSPLTYSVRYPPYSAGAFGVMTDVAGSDYASTRRMFKYHKGEVYVDTRWARIVAERLVWPKLRPLVLGWTAPSERDEILNAPFSLPRYLAFLARVSLGDRSKRPYAALKHFERHWRSEAVTQRSAGLSAEELKALSDGEVVEYIARQHSYEDEFGRFVTFPAMIWLTGMMSVVELMISHWYDGDNASAFVDLMSGSTRQTDTQRENLMLWRLSERIRHSQHLRAVFESHPDREFFTALEGTEEGRAFLAEYHSTIGRFPHRGEADRDMVYPRREDDPGIDYRTFRALLNVEPSVDPETIEREANQRREAAVRDVIANLRKQRFGRARAKAFREAHTLLHRLVAFRDDERQNPTDLVMMSYKRGFLEIGRRLVERGVLAAADDVHYLSKRELFDLFEGRAGNGRLLEAKIAGRRRDVDRMLSGEAQPPKFLQHGRPVDLEPLPEGTDAGRWTGQPFSAGTVTGTARVVTRLADIGRVNQGEILVVHATDPGWTPVFLLVRGVVVEAGGPLAHAACLSREYGLPALQLAGAMKLIPDGATITVDGSTGTVTLVDAPTSVSAPG